MLPDKVINIIIPPYSAPRANCASLYLGVCILLGENNLEKDEGPTFHYLHRCEDWREQLEQQHSSSRSASQYYILTQYHIYSTHMPYFQNDYYYGTCVYMHVYGDLSSKM